MVAHYRIDMIRPEQEPELRTEVGIPPKEPAIRVRVDNPTPEWCGFVYEAVGVYAPDLPPGRALLLRLGGLGPPLAILVYRQRMYPAGTVACVETRWVPGSGHKTDTSGLKRMQAAAAFLRTVRRRGRLTLEEEPWQDWREIARKARTEKRQDRLTWPQVSARHGVPVSTLKRWVSKLDMLEPSPPAG